MKTLLIYIILLCSLYYVEHSLEWWTPDPVNGHQIITYSEFVLSYNEETEQADWVAYELTDIEAMSNEAERCNSCFRSDPMVSTGSAHYDDYTNTGFDRGHLAPYADFQFDQTLADLTFRMSNISPQSPRYNRVIARSLEASIRESSIRYGSVVVVSGPIFIDDLGSIGHNNVRVPSHFYKCLLWNIEGSFKSLAFVIPNLNPADDVSIYATSVNQVETLTGIDFFPALPNSIENKVESQYSTRYISL